MFADTLRYMVASLDTVHRELVGGNGVRVKDYFPYESLSVDVYEAGYLDQFPAQQTFGGRVQLEAHFVDWYNTELRKFNAEKQADSNYRYAIREILEDYCRKDVRLLAEAGVKFTQVITLKVLCCLTTKKKSSSSRLVIHERTTDFRLLLRTTAVGDMWATTLQFQKAM